MRRLILSLILANSVIYSIIFSFIFDKRFVAFLDIGEGASVLIKDGKNVFLYDTGKYSSRLFKQLDNKLGFYNKKIDILFISHPDKDHYFSAFELLERYEVRLVVVTKIDSQDTLYQKLIQLVKKKKIPLIVLKRGDIIKTNNFKILVLNPSNNLKEKIDDNNTSLVLKVFGKNTYLLTGDIEQKAIKDLISCCFNLLQADIFLVPHHGSKYSLNKDFYFLVSPKISVIQVGDNYYGHPHFQVIRTLSQFSKIWRTDKNGLLLVDE